MNIAWFILITVTFVILQNIIYKRWGLKNINYKRFFSHQAVFEGNQIEMVDQIANKKLLPIPWLRLESKVNPNLQFNQNNDVEIESESFHRTLFSLLPYQKITRRHKITCSKRGYYQLSTVSLSTGDPFGIGEIFHNVDAKASITVYPKLVSIKQIELPSHSLMGDIMVRRWIMEDPFVHAGVREYAYGDAMSNVNWKATARTNRLQVSKKDFTADHHLMIYLNLDETEDIWLPIKKTDIMEKGISYAASIAQYAISQGISTGFGCNGFLVEPFGTSDKIKNSVRITPNNNQNQLTYIWDTMAKLATGRSMNFHYFLQEDINNRTNNLDIILITQILTENMKASIRNLEAQGNAVRVVWLDSESDEGSSEVGDRHVI